MKKTRKKDPFFDRESENYESPLPSREFIIQVMEEEGVPLKKKDLLNILNIKKAEEDIFNRRLRAMLRDGQILKNRKETFCLPTKLNAVSGKIQGHPDGFGFLIPDEPGNEDIFLSPVEMKKAFHNDRVIVQISSKDRRGRLEGKIIEVLERANTVLVGRVINSFGVTIVAAEDKRINQDIIIPYGQDLDAKAGNIVEVEITTQPALNAKPMGKIIEILGDIHDSGIEIEIALRKHKLPFKFNDKVLKEVKKITFNLDDLSERQDLRDFYFVTIDGETAKDFDDAVYAEENSNGFRLLVAIADVSHYVKEKTALNDEAFLRGNSVYFPRRVIPMLPEKLSNDLCSLNPNVDRLCMVCDMSIDNNGNIDNYNFSPAVINSKQRLTYTFVNEIIFLKEKKVDPILENHLMVLKKVYQVFLRKRKERHAIDFETNESLIHFNENGKIEKISTLQRNEAHKLIEEAMLAANVCAADFLLESKFGMFRNHEKPKEEKLEILKSVLSDFKVYFDGGSDPKSQNYVELIDKLKNHEARHILQTMILRSMQQANYGSENKGHFGLSYDKYTHFTSPIRRYPDLIVHRLIKQRLKNDKKSIEQKHLNDIALHCSSTERRADEATRDVESWLKCFYMKDRIGEVFDVIVSSVTNFGLFVEIQEMYIEGLVHITELGNDYFIFKKELQMLEGEKSKNKFKLGDKLTVKLIRVDLDLGKIDFSLIKKR